MGKAVQRFEIGKYYQFVGEPIVRKRGESLITKPGAVNEELLVNDVEIFQNWMDRGIRKCLDNAFDGTSASFEDLYFNLRGDKVPWHVLRSYQCYLEAGMFQEVEVQK